MKASGGIMFSLPTHWNYVLYASTNIFGQFDLLKLDILAGSLSTCNFDLPTFS